MFRIGQPLLFFLQLLQLPFLERGRRQSVQYRLIVISLLVSRGDTLLQACNLRAKVLVAAI